MNMEGVFEDESQLRRCVENELLSDTNISPEQALKVYRKNALLYSFMVVICTRRES